MPSSALHSHCPSREGSSDVTTPGGAFSQSESGYAAGPVGLHPPRLPGGPEGELRAVIGNESEGGPVQEEGVA
eukprot:2802839-Pyramimonas_sp.AAC.1